MAEADERLERLITRRLDGEITEAEAIELDARVRESPEARELLERCRRQDEAVRSVLCEALGAAAGHRFAGTVPAVPRESGAMRLARALWWPLPAATAAAAVIAVLIGAAVYFGPGMRHHSSGAADIADVTTRATDNDRAEAVTAETWPADDAMVADHPLEAVSREVIGVVGEDGKTIYLLEMDRTRTAIVPVGGEL